MIILLANLILANPDEQVGVYGIEGQGNTQLRQKIEEKLNYALVNATVNEKVWVVFPKEQRKRLQKIEAEIDCVENCVLPIAQQLGLDKVKI